MGLLVEQFDAFKIKRTGSKTRPRKMLYFDTETKTQPGDGIVKHRMKMAWACYVEKRSGDRRDTVAWTFWEEPIELQRYIDSLVKEKTTLWVFGHNIFFDLQCSDFFYYFTREGWVLDFYYDKGLTYILCIRKGKRTIKCLSTTNYFPVSLKKLGKLTGLHKIDVDFEGDSHEEIKRYCRRDVEIIKAGMEKYYDFIDKYELGKFGLSRAGQAFIAYRHRFMHEDIFTHRNEEVTAFEREAYFGGRVECRFIGEVKDGPFVSLDINSMYPYVMRNKMYPRKLIDHIDKPIPEQITSALRRRCVVAKCYVDTDDPAYPVRHKNKIIFPIGCFPVYLCTEGLEYAREANHIVHVDEMYIYEKANLFTEYVDLFTALKTKYSKLRDGVMRQIAKDFQNALYGKFGQNKPLIDEEVEVTNAGYSREVVKDLVTGREEITTTLFNKRFVEYGKEVAPNSLVAIAAHVTEYARFYLLRLIQRAGYENVLYTDTDSIKIRKKYLHLYEDIIDEFELGYLGIEEEFERFVIHGPKDYETENMIKIKGVPKSAKKMSDGSYTYTSFPRQSTHLSKQVTRYYITRPTVKRLKREYTKGVVHKDGRVTPLKIKVPYVPS